MDRFAQLPQGGGWVTGASTRLSSISQCGTMVMSSFWNPASLAPRTFLYDSLSLKGRGRQSGHVELFQQKQHRPVDELVPLQLGKRHLGTFWAKGHGDRKTKEFPNKTLVRKPAIKTERCRGDVGMYHVKTLPQEIPEETTPKLGVIGNSRFPRCIRLSSIRRPWSRVGRHTCHAVHHFLKRAAPWRRQMGEP